MNRVISEGGDKRMDNLSLRPNDEEIENTVNAYSNMLFRLCFTILRNNQDAEDAVSDVFMKYISENRDFADEEHKKAWLISIATNRCRDMLKFYKVRQHLKLEDVVEYCGTNDDFEVCRSFWLCPKNTEP